MNSASSGGNENTPREEWTTEKENKNNRTLDYGIYEFLLSSSVFSSLSTHFFSSLSLSHAHMLVHAYTHTHTHISYEKHKPGLRLLFKVNVTNQGNPLCQIIKMSLKEN